MVTNTLIQKKPFFSLSSSKEIDVILLVGSFYKLDAGFRFPVIHSQSDYPLQFWHVFCVAIKIGQLKKYML